MERAFGGEERKEMTANKTVNSQKSSQLDFANTPVGYKNPSTTSPRNMGPAFAGMSGAVGNMADRSSPFMELDSYGCYRILLIDVPW